MSIIAKYKFNSSIYADLIPEFNSEFTDYTVTDEVDSENSNHIIRTIESDNLPTLMRFGRVYVEGESTTDNRTDSLLEVLDINTSGLTSCHSMFRYNKNLTSIICEWDTSNVTTMNAMFYGCNNLTSLDVSNFNTSNVTTMQQMFRNCNNLTSLYVSNFNTSNVIRMNYMFYNCNNLTSLDVSNFNTSNVINMNYMFYNCNKLTSLDVSNFDISNVTDMSNMFDCCLSLTEIHGISNWDTSNVANMVATFGKCESLIELNLSGWDISSVTNADNLFGQCFSLVTLDISNFKFSTNCIITNIFNENLGNIPLTDIGMLYCDQSTINKVASLLPNDTTQTIWVEDVDAKDLTPVEGVEFKQYAKNTEIMLNSPLLEGDRIEVVDGKLCHYHKMGKIVLDGSEDWLKSSVSGKQYQIYYVSVPNGKYSQDNTVSGGIVKSDRFPTKKTYNDMLDNEELGVAFGNSSLGISVSISELLDNTPSSLKQWLSENPTTVVYELANPYYEVLQDKPLSLTLVSEDNDISNSSNIPTNMIVDNRPLPTIGMGGSKEYTIAFDKSDEESSVVVNLCGSSIETTDNIVHITTPSTIENNELTILGNGEEISNVRILEGNVVDKGIPRESFEGLKSSFEDGYIPNSIPIEFSRLELGNINSDTGATMSSSGIVRTPLLTVTSDKITLVIVNANYTLHKVILYDSEGNFVTGRTELIDGMKLGVVTVSEGCSQFRLCLKASDVSVINQSNLFILEGDCPHLTLTEDLNNLGKYKVEYKVTGKNKFNVNGDINQRFSNALIDINSPNRLVDGILYAGNYSDNHHGYGQMVKLRKNTNYIISGNCANRTGVICLHTPNQLNTTLCQCINNFEMNFNTLDNEDFCISFLNHGDSSDTTIAEFTNVQLEEGSTATEYEPYKEQIKTFYLNSPLLEGDTIEDVNGVATHVHRYEKVVFDGSHENLVLYSSNDIAICFQYTFATKFADGNWVSNGKCINDKGFYSGNSMSVVQLVDDSHMFAIGFSDIYTYISIPKSKLSTPDKNGFKQWLQANPTTVVYQLATPWYEPIGAYGKVVLNGSENWEKNANGNLFVYTNPDVIKGVAVPSHIAPNIKCDILNVISFGDGYEGNVDKGITFGDSKADRICIRNSSCATIDVFKQWLQQNPVTVIYKLEQPQYQGSTLCDSYVNGHLDIDSDIPVEEVQFMNAPSYDMKYLNKSTYTIQFESDNIGILERVRLADATIDNMLINKGLNKLNLTVNDLSTIHENKLYLIGIGFNASNIQVVQADENVEFDYFEGLQSSFEDTPIEILDRSSIVENHCLTWGSGESFAYEKYYHTDYIPVQPCEKYETSCPVSVFLYDENKQFICYSDKLTGWKTGGEGGLRVTEWVIPLDKTNVKYMRLESQLTLGAIKDFKLFDHKQYKVECKVEGKNKFDGSLPERLDYAEIPYYLKKGTYIFSADVSGYNDGRGFTIAFADKDNRTITNTQIGYYTILHRDCYKLYFYSNSHNYSNSIGNYINVTNFQIEEGTQATPYEPYKSYTKTFYLNSPLLQGDTIEEVNGKMCHVHRMGKVVLDGNSTIIFRSIEASVISFRFKLPDDARCSSNSNSPEGGYTFISDRLLLTDSLLKHGIFDGTALHTYNGETFRVGYLSLLHEYITNDISSITWSVAETNAKQWLSENPTTIVYELAKPWYEPIEPEQQNLTITSIKDADLHIDTVVPISSTVTYNVNVKLLTDFEESIISQVQNANEVNLLSILDEEIDN